MLRTIDHGGYYETRLILMEISLMIAGYFSFYQRDRRFWLMFASGAVFTALTEYLLQASGLRGAGYGLSLFGMPVPAEIGPAIQGLTEGGAYSLFAFWFADLRSARVPQKRWWSFYLLCAVVVGLALVAALAARHLPVSSARPMYAGASIIAVTAIIFISLAVAWRRNALSDLANFCGGLLLFAFLNNEPLQLFGARYIGVAAGPTWVAASTPIQIAMMFLSNIFEAAGSRLHFFVVPFALGWITLTVTDPRKPYSTEELLDLAQRGWKRRSSPFKRDSN
ncbi:MAG TPA: hypothetical protein VJ302_31310 [Blastocatellia bacterium]|nr:hypothetical protein [Blastocatellia bacterium]